MTFTATVRDELAAIDPANRCCRLAEASALLRFGGLLALGAGTGGGVAHAVVTTSGAVARRLHALLLALFACRAVITVQAASGLQARRYRLELGSEAAVILRELSLLDDGGQPLDAVPGALTRKACDAASYARGAFLAAGSISALQRPVHFEVRAPGEPSAAGLAELLRRCGAPSAKASPRGRGIRVVCKSSEQIASLLARMGAHGAFLQWDENQLRRELREEANRIANADRANLARGVAATQQQLAAVQRALAHVDVDELPDDIREVALARLANPDATLAELGALLDPPVGKVTVHRRLARLAALSETV